MEHGQRHMSGCWLHQARCPSRCRSRGQRDWLPFWNRSGAGGWLPPDGPVGRDPQGLRRAGARSGRGGRRSLHRAVLLKRVAPAQVVVWSQPAGPVRGSHAAPPAGSTCSCAGFAGHPAEVRQQSGRFQRAGQQPCAEKRCARGLISSSHRTCRRSGADPPHWPPPATTWDHRDYCDHQWGWRYQARSAKGSWKGGDADGPRVCRRR
jgi:hypothetical protein